MSKADLVKEYIELWDKLESETGKNLIQLKLRRTGMFHSYMAHLGKNRERLRELKTILKITT